MDWLRHRLSLLIATPALMLCTCAPWGARAEFEGVDSVNLKAIKEALTLYHQGVSTQLGILSLESQEQTLLQTDLHKYAFDSRAHLQSIRVTALDAAASLASIDSALNSSGSSLVDIDNGVSEVNESVETISYGLSGEGQSSEDWGELGEFAPADIDESVSPYEDGQTILNSGSNAFKNSFDSFLTDVSSRLSISGFWPMESWQESFTQYISTAPLVITLYGSFSFRGYNVPALKLDWTSLRSNLVLTTFRRVVSFVLYGLFGLGVFYRLSSVI